MNWKLEYLPEAEKDLKDLDGSQRKIHCLLKNKVMENRLVITAVLILPDF